MRDWAPKPGRTTVLRAGGCARLPALLLPLPIGTPRRAVCPAPQLPGHRHPRGEECDRPHHRAALPPRLGSAAHWQRPQPLARVRAAEAATRAPAWQMEHCSLNVLHCSRVCAANAPSTCIYVCLQKGQAVTAATRHATGWLVPGGKKMARAHRRYRQHCKQYREQLAAKGLWREACTQHASRITPPWHRRRQIRRLRHRRRRAAAAAAGPLRAGWVPHAPAHAAAALLSAPPGCCPAPDPPACRHPALQPQGAQCRGAAKSAAGRARGPASQATGQGQWQFRQHAAAGGTSAQQAGPPAGVRRRRERGIQQLHPAAASSSGSRTDGVLVVELELQAAQQVLPPQLLHLRRMKGGSRWREMQRKGTGQAATVAVLALKLAACHVAWWEWRPSRPGERRM